MNIRYAAFIGAVSVASFLCAAEPAIEFSGVMTTGGKTQLALTNTATKTTTWLEPGDQFNGYTIARYDPSEDAVFLKKDGRETRLGLISSKTPEAGRPATLGAAASAATPADATAIANAIRANLRQLVAAARQYQLERGTTSVAFPDLVGPDKLIKELKPIAGENYSTLSFGPNVTGVSVTTTNGAIIALDIPTANASVPAAGTVTTQAPPPANAAVAAQTSSPVNAAAPAIASASIAAAPAANPPVPTATASSPAPTAPVASAYTPVVPPVAEPIASTGRQPASPSYTIQGADTWQKISEATGVPVQRLKELNPAILEGSPLPSGQTIRVH